MLDAMLSVQTVRSCLPIIHRPMVSHGFSLCPPVPSSTLPPLPLRLGMLSPMVSHSPAREPLPTCSHRLVRLTAPLMAHISMFQTAGHVPFVVLVLAMPWQLRAERTRQPPSCLPTPTPIPSSSVVLRLRPRLLSMIQVALSNFHRVLPVPHSVYPTPCPHLLRSLLMLLVIATRSTL